MLCFPGDDTKDALFVVSAAVSNYMGQLQYVLAVLLQVKLIVLAKNGEMPKRARIHIACYENGGERSVR